MYMYMSYRKERQNSAVADPECNKKEPAHDKTNKMTCAPSEHLDQPGHRMADPEGIGGGG